MLKIEIEISDERIQEVCDMLNNWYKTIITPEKLEPVLKDSANLDLVGEIIDNTYSDTCPREQLISAIVDHYLEDYDEWPSNSASEGYSENFKVLAADAGLLPPQTVEGKIRLVIEEYYKALDNRKNGNFAQTEAFHKIEDILGMRWHG